MCPICLVICNLLERPLHNPFFDTVCVAILKTQLGKSTPTRGIAANPIAASST